MLFAGAGYLFYQWQAGTRALDPVAIGKMVLAAQFMGLDDQPQALEQWRGKVLVVNFWATWCAPCREEMPALERLQAELGGPAFQVLAVSVDEQGAEVAQRFFKEIGVRSLELYIDRSARAAFELEAPGLPVSVLVDRQGREIGRKLGAAKWDAPEVVADLRRRITRAE
jgi:thiol-disulfide isomerase/thioredoxin